MRRIGLRHRPIGAYPPGAARCDGYAREVRVVTRLDGELAGGFKRGTGDARFGPARMRDDRGRPCGLRAPRAAAVDRKRLIGRRRSRRNRNAVHRLFGALVFKARLDIERILLNNRVVDMRVVYARLHCERPGTRSGFLDGRAAHRRRGCPRAFAHRDG